MKYKIEIRWAFIFIVMALVWMVFEKSMGWHGENIAQHETHTNWFAIPAIMIYVFALLDKKKNFYYGNMSWKQGFVSGLIISVIVALFSPLSQIITHQLISPEYFPNAIAYAVKSEKATLIEAQSFFSLGNYILISVIGALMMGVLTSAIVALIVKSKTKKRMAMSI